MARGNEWRSHCDRCGADLNSTAHTMSKFNTDTICLQCKEDEEGAPNYARASGAELAAVQAGDYNYPGIGLAPEDEVYLRERRDARKGGSR